MIPSLIGVIHLQPLPGSPRYEGRFENVVAAARADAQTLERAGFDAALLENFGDAPFFPKEVDAVTVAAMTRCALAVREAASELFLGINVLRNDAEAALAVALASEASFVRINVHCGARLTDQGVIQGEAHATLRRRRELGLDRVKLCCDVAVKHSAALAQRPIEEEAVEAVERALADAVLVTGAATGATVSAGDLDAVLGVVRVPVLVASGAKIDALADLAGAHGVVVGSALRASGRAGDPIDGERARAFAEAFSLAFRR